MAEREDKLISRLNAKRAAQSAPETPSTNPGTIETPGLTGLEGKDFRTETKAQTLPEAYEAAHADDASPIGEPATEKKPYLNRKEEKNADPNNIDDFIKDFDLEGSIPPEFNSLSLNAKYMVVRQATGRMLDVVQADSQTQYSEEYKSKSFLKKIAASITRASDLKGIEVEVFKKFKEGKEGREIMLENLKQISLIAQGREVVLNKNGEPEIVALKPEDFRGVPLEIIEEFNGAVNEFRNKPYEWSQQEGVIAINRRRYGRAEKAYEAAKIKILEISSTAKDKAGTVEKMLKIDNMIRLDQLINTHPEIEKEFVRVSEEAGWAEIGKNILDLGGKGRLNKALFAGGYATRALTASMGLMSWASAPTIGLAIGGLRGRIRGKETLAESKKDARYGKKGALYNKERAEFTTNQAAFQAEDLAKKLGKLEDEATTWITIKKNAGWVYTDEQLKDKFVSKLDTRINYTLKVIEEGRVNFGDSKTSLVAQHNLIKELSDAMVARASLGEDVENKIAERLEKLSGHFSEGVNDRQKKYINKQMLMGAGMGAGVAIAGYVVRVAAENWGWWGGGQSSQVPEEPKIPESLWQDVESESSSAPVAPDSAVIHPQEAPDEPTDIKFKTHVPPPDEFAETTPAPGSTPTTGAEAVPEAGASTQNLESAPPLDKNAIVGKGQGIEHAFRKQIEADPEKFDFKGDVNDRAAVREFSGRKAHEFAGKFGYVDGAKEIRVGPADKIAYQLVEGEDGKFKVLERIVDEDGRIHEPHAIGDKFETVTEKYEYVETVKKALKEAYDAEHKLPPPPKIEIPTDIKIPEETYTPDVHGHGVEKSIGKNWDHTHDKHLDKMEVPEKPVEEYGGHGKSGRGGRILGPEDFTDHSKPVARPVLDRFPSTGTDVIYDSRYGIVHEANPGSPVGIATSQEIIEAAFAGTSVHLPEETVEKIYVKTVDVIFEDWFKDTSNFDAAKRVANDVLDSSAKDLVADEVEHGGDKLHTPVYEFIQKAKEVLGKDFEPKGNGFFRKAESVSDFIKRAIETAAEKGKLGKLMG